MTSKNNKDIKPLLQKYIARKCSPAELEEVISFFQKDSETDSSVLPSVEEVLELLEKQRLPQEASRRIYSQILKSPKRPVKSPVLALPKRRRWKTRTIPAAAAAVLLVLICSRLFLDFGSTSEQQLIQAPAEAFVTLELENGEQTTIGTSDSLELVDAEGTVIGTQKGSSIIYAPEKQTASLTYNTLRVPHGKQFELSLSDGTKVFLNAGTSLKFPTNFVAGKNREVFLTGEAFFEVAENKSQPFIVNTGKLQVEVLGTQFNVAAYESEAEQSVVLVEGKVKVKNETQELLMAPNEMLETSGTQLRSSTVDPADFTSWKQGYFTLKEASVKETIALLERYYNIEIHSEDQKDLDKIAGSGKVFLSRDIQNVITTLSLLTSNSYSFEYRHTPESTSNYK